MIPLDKLAFAFWRDASELREGLRSDPFDVECRFPFIDILMTANHTRSARIRARCQQILDRIPKEAQAAIDAAIDADDVIAKAELAALG